MNILSIGSDRKLFEEGSAVRNRAVLYGARVDSMAIIVLTTRAHNLPTTPIPISSKVTLYPTVSAYRLLYIFDAYKVGKNIVRSWLANTSLITAQDPFESGLAAYWLSQKFNFKLQLQIHTDFLSPYFHNESLLNRIRIWIAHKILPKADSVRVVSERIASSIKQAKILIKKPVDILPIYVDVQKISAIVSRPVETPSVFQKFDTTVLMVSRLEKEKNVEQGIHVFCRALKKLPQDISARTALVIVGDGSRRKELEELVKKTTAVNNIFFVGWQNDLAAYYRSAQIFLQTSCYEGYGMSLAEAALYGCPIITTDVGIAGTILKHSVSACIVPVEDSEGLTKYLEELILKPVMRDTLAIAAKEAVTASLLPSEQAYVDRYVSLWEECLR